jgi:acyl carrier protein
MSPTEIGDTLATFIRREFRVLDDDPDFSWDAHLFESGYVDSAGVVELITFIESRFGLKLDDDEVFSERFTTISGIAGVVSVGLTEERAPGPPRLSRNGDVAPA